MGTITEWAVIADAQHCRVFARAAPAGRWDELAERAIEISNPRSHERGTDQPGRVQESATAAHHAIEPRSDPHREAKRAFARQLAERLETAATEGSFGRLTLVAPPPFLGDLRAALLDRARARVVASLDKDLTRLPQAEIVEQLEFARSK
ncbi:host attachment protein [Falsiroseomonas sp. HC035]|uniref:host attachment protein n=1 Tax=Falsiroseomonas sp. HC035 TaxID=3390999 RepID=UPI003D31BF04